MHIKRIAVESWRGLTCEMSDLSPALNLIYGPNESGKSRLVEALRFALLESSSGKSKYKVALQTRGHDGRPRVEVDFDLAGTRWLLEKSYLGTGCNTVLRGAGRTLEGEEAEARLADLMGVSPSGRTELKSSERGIWSLLWVDQGESREAPGHNQASQARLQDQLSTEIGEVAAGELGQRILERTEECRNQFYTASRETERPVLRDARENVENLEATLEIAEKDHRAVAEDADSLQQLRQEDQELKDRVAEAEGAHAELSERHGLGIEAARELERCRHQAQVARLELERHQHAWNEYVERSQQITHLDEEIETLEHARTDAEGSLQAAEAAVTITSARLSDDDAAVAASGAHRQTLLKRQKAAALSTEKDQLESRLEEAETLIARVKANRDALAELPEVTAADVERLRAAHQAAEEARARLEGASASVELNAHRDLAVDGTALAAGSSRVVLVEDEKRIDIDGLLSIVVHPGGGELPRLRDALADARRDLASLLPTLGVGSIPEADQIAQNRRDLEAEWCRDRDALTRQLPEGRDELNARLREIELQLGDLGDEAGADFDAEALEQAEARERELVDAREKHRVQRDKATSVLNHVRDTVRVLEIQRNGKDQQRNQLAERLGQMPDKTALEEHKEVAGRTQGERVAACDEAQRKFERLGGEGLELDLRQAAQAVQQLRESRRDVQDRCISIEGRLSAPGSGGHYDRVQDRQAELNQAQADLARIDREALSARRLYQVLNEEYQNARERLTQPVITRIRPYLAELFPGCEAWLDEEMNLLGMRGDRFEEEFDSLSGGAREQLSLLVRIGLAEVIGAEESWPLVLDDVLVNTDADRIKRVQRLLFKAARNMQILLFTCHGPLFDMLGPDRRIELAPPEVRRG